jgi:predicted short-subunit dehydrogenase-like oxidoreductase (DUF2520 family)
MLTAEVLEPLRVRGAAVFSFHPLQTFPRDFAPRDILSSARGIFYGVDGMPRALTKARRLAGILGGRVIEIPPEMRAFYHASCVLASNHLTTMLSILENMFGVLRAGKTGFFDVYRPILMATLKNIEATSPARALSGPIARGGVETVAEHFSAISRFAPELVPYFAHLSLETVRLAKSKGSISDAQAQAMTELARRYMTSIHYSPETN